MEEHRGGARARDRPAAGPGQGVLRLHRDAGGQCALDGGFQPGQALELIGPDVGLEPSPRHRVAHVHRRAVAGRPLDDLHTRVQGRRRAAPVGVQPDPGAVVAPASGLAQVVVIAVPELVEPGAGGDLEAPDRQAGRRRHRQEAGQQGNGPAGLIGLRLVAHEGGDAAGLGLQQALRHTPCRRRIAVEFRRRVECAQRRRLAAERQVVQGAEQPQGNRVGDLGAGVPAGPGRHQGAGRPAVGGVFRRLAQDLGGEGRSHGLAGLGLQTQGAHGRVLVAHERRSARWLAPGNLDCAGQSAATSTAPAIRALKGAQVIRWAAHGPSALSAR